jgi:hypothetical protein
MYSNQNLNVIVFSAFVIIFYTITPNMSLVLGSAILLTDLLWTLGMVTTETEGMTNKTELTYDEFKEKVTNALVDVDATEAGRENIQFVKVMKSLQEVKPKTYYESFKTNYNKLKNRTWVDENILDLNSVVVVDNPKKEVYLEEDINKMKQAVKEPSGYDENESSKDASSSYPGETSDLLEKVKKSTPELAESLKTLKGMDMDQINKLINNLNAIMEKF